jgi:hypothetical protein
VKLAARRADFSSRRPQVTPTKLKTSVMITGAGHSGSTLLGMVLAGLPGSVYVGEGAKARFLHDPKKPLRKRACKMCGEDCAFWRDFSWDGIEPLHRLIAAHAGADIVIDSTKQPDWIRDRAAEARAAGASVRLIFLVRDGRAVINSRLRKYPQRDPGAQIQDWISQMAAAQALTAEFAADALTLRYESLATEPEAVTRRLAAFIGASWRAEMIEFASRSYHLLGGNSGTQYLAAREQGASGPAAALNERSKGYYSSHGQGIRLDLRWRDELAAGNAELFDRLAGAVNAPLAWED